LKNVISKYFSSTLEIAYPQTPQSIELFVPAQCSHVDFDG